MTTETTTGPRIYVASLADYNAGRLHGVWIDAARDPEDIRAEVQEMLAASPENAICQACGAEYTPNAGWTYATARPVCRFAPAHVPGNAEEWAIHDYEGFGALRLSEHESFEKVAELGQAIDEHGEAFAAYAANEGADYATVDGFEEAFAGEWDSLEDFAADLVDSLGLNTLPDDLSAYFDVARFARDLILGGDYWTADAGSGLYVFRSI